MSKVSKIVCVALMGAALPALSLPAAAVPIASPHPFRTLQNAMAPSVEPIQFRRRGFRGGIGLGIAGALIGGAIIGATQPYGYPYGPYGYGGYYAYPGPGYAVAPYPAGNAVAYCMQRFRSYDPSSGTYLGRDGYRHPCP